MSLLRPSPNSRPDLTPRAVRKRPPMTQQLVDWLRNDWAPAPRMPHPALDCGVAAHTGGRRAALSEQFAGQLVVVPSGQLRTRANDTQYPFRARVGVRLADRRDGRGRGARHAPRAGGRATTRPCSSASTTTRGPRGTSPTTSSGRSGSATCPPRPRPRRRWHWHACRWPSCPRSWPPGATTRAPCSTGHDPLLDPLLPGASGDRLGPVIDELRLAKDDWEIAPAPATPATPPLAGSPTWSARSPTCWTVPVRGERWLEGTFWRRARLEGNEVGYTSIVGSGAHGDDPALVAQPRPAALRRPAARRHGRRDRRDPHRRRHPHVPADRRSGRPRSARCTPPCSRRRRRASTRCRVGNDFLAAHRAAMWVLAEHLHDVGHPRRPRRTSPAATDPDRPGAGRHRRSRCTGCRTASGSTCTTAPMLATRSTRTARWATTTCSRSNRGCTSRSTTCQRSRRVARHQRPHRGRHPGDRERAREPRGALPPRPRRDHSLDAPVPSRPRRSSIIGDPIRDVRNRARDQPRPGRRPPGSACSSALGARQREELALRRGSPRARAASGQSGESQPVAERRQACASSIGRPWHTATACAGPTARRERRGSAAADRA